MLLDTEATVKINSKNKTYYETLGYGRVFCGQTLLVDINHLQEFCAIKVTVACDLCGKVRQIQYKNHFAKPPGQYLCKSCSQTTHKTIEELQEEFLTKNYRLVSTEYVNATIPLKYECLRHPGPVRSIPYTDFASGKQKGCANCGAERASEKLRLTSDEAAGRFIEHGYIMTGTFVDTDTPVKFTCIIHPEYDQKISIAGLSREGAGCKYCKGSRVTDKHIRKYFLDNNCLLLNEGIVTARTGLRFVCADHPLENQSTAWGNFVNWTGCRYCGIEKRSGENNHLWKGGVTEITAYLRDRVLPWVAASYAVYGNACVISGEQKDVIIHHLFKNFSEIRDEAHTSTKIEIKPTIGAYSVEDLSTVTKVCLSKHFSYGLGVCISRSLHLEFHSMYGRFNNTELQFREFYFSKVGTEFTPKPKYIHK